MVFNPNEDAQVLDPGDEDYEEQLLARQEKEQAQQEKTKAKALRGAQPNAPMPPVPPATISGYGVVGLTRGERVRRRLRALKNSLAIALGRLAQDGSLVVLWPGLPLHPVLFFLAGERPNSTRCTAEGSLRKIFLRVHVLSPEGKERLHLKRRISDNI